MKVPRIGKPRSAAAAFSLSRKLPKLQLPASAATTSAQRPHPQIGKPGRSLFGGGAPAGKPPTTGHVSLPRNGRK